MKQVFNPYTGKPDYILDSDTIARNLYGLGVMLVVAGPMVTGTDPPQMTPSTAAQVAHLLSIGIPEAYIGWSVTGSESISGSYGTFALPSVTLAPIVAAPTLTGIQVGSFALPGVTLQPVVAAPSLSGVQVGSFALPSVTLTPVVAAPSLVGVQTGNFTLPAVTLQPQVSAPTLVGLQDGVGSFDLPTVTLQPQVASPSLVGVQVGAFTLPSVSLQPVVSAPSLVGAQAGSFAIPVVSLRPVVTAPSLAASVATPATPTQSALTAGDTQLTANWADVTGETSYTVYYSTASDLDGTNYTAGTPYPGTPDATAGKITGVAANSVSQAITGLTNGTTYYVRVSASNAAGESALSSVQNSAPRAPMYFEDLFNRADTTTLGADWTNASWATAGLKILSNKAQGQTSGSFSTAPQSVSYLNATAHPAGPNQYAEGTVPDVSFFGAQLLLRVSPSAETYYALRFDGAVFKVVGGTNRGTYFSDKTGVMGTVTGTDVIRFSAEGTSTVTLKIYKNGSLVATVTDSTSPITSGQPGIRSSSSSWDAIDNFKAGEL